MVDKIILELPADTVGGDILVSTETREIAEAAAVAAQAAASVASNASTTATTKAGEAFNSAAAAEAAKLAAQAVPTTNDTVMASVAADSGSAFSTQLSATMGAYLDVNVPVEVSDALASDPVVQAGVGAAIDTGLPLAISATLPGAVATEVNAQVGPFVTAAAGSATAAQTARTGAEAARDLALAGQFRGTSLGTADLNTIITPGVYYQASAVSATLARNYPAPGRSNLLEVFWPNSNTGVAVTQKITLTWDNAGARGIYQRVKFDIGETWQPWRFIPTQRVDQTAGRAIYTWDDVNNREQLIYGDTGWRELTLENGWSGSIRARRLSVSSVEVIGRSLVPGTAITSVTLPSGFRPQQTFPLFGRPATATNPPAYGELTSGGLVQFPTTSAFHASSFQAIFSTLDTWPTTLPGVAVGSIP